LGSQVTWGPKRGAAAGPSAAVADTWQRGLQVGAVSPTSDQLSFQSFETSPTSSARTSESTMSHLLVIVFVVEVVVHIVNAVGASTINDLVCSSRPSVTGRTVTDAF
jgi:hypothetical protein